MRKRAIIHTDINMFSRCAVVHNHPTYSVSIRIGYSGCKQVSVYTDWI